MLIYKDILSGDEMFSDTYKMETLHDGQVIRVTGKNKTETTDIDDSMFGGNKSAEGGCDDEGADSASVSGIDVVLDNRLKETGFGKKKEFQVYVKDYIGSIMKKLTDSKAEQAKIDSFKKGAMSFVKEVLADFDEYQFFMGESMDSEGSLAYVKWDGETPYIYFLKASLEEEKV